jgi:hypothetical protein
MQCTRRLWQVVGQVLLLELKTLMIFKKLYEEVPSQVLMLDVSLIMKGQAL